MRLFVLPPSYKGEETILLTDAEYHRVVRVLRKKEGDSFNTSDGRGNLYHATVEHVGLSSCQLRIQERGPLKRPFPEFTLFQCLPKGKKFDLIVRQAVELGVQRIVPVISRYSVPKWEEPKEKIGRLKRIAREAAQQSGAIELPEILSPLPLEDIPDFWKPAEPERLGLFFHQAPLARSTIHQYLSLHPKEIAFVIGPEGGLAERETQTLWEGGFSPVYLGPTVLRTETASVFAIASIQIILLERTAWKLQPQPDH